MHLVGRTLAGKYAVVRAIGQGGMGVVFEARDVVLGRPVALKALFDADERSLARFRQEAAAMAAVEHPNVAAVFDFQHLPDEPPFIVMELVDGASLAGRMKREGRFPIERAVAITSQILDGLDAAHAAGVVHRDVKPGNILLTSDDVVKLVDFGIAKMLDGSGVRTTTGAVIGTPAYLAPEQITGRAVDARTDLHAVGLVFYEMLTGRRWSRDATPLADLPPHLADVIRRATSFDQGARFPSARAMKNALAEPKPHPLPPPPRRRWRLFLIALGSTLASSAAIAVALAMKSAPVVAPVPPPSTSPPVVASFAPEPPPPPEPAQPTEPTEATAPSAAPPRPMASSAPRARCFCAQLRSNGHLGPHLCPKKDPVRCMCVADDSSALCKTDLEADGRCAQHWAYAGSTGEDCLGLRQGKAGWASRGTLSCDYCYRGQSVPLRGMPGGPCEGFEPGGKRVDGVFVCE